MNVSCIKLKKNVQLFNQTQTVRQTDMTSTYLLQMPNILIALILHIEILRCCFNVADSILVEEGGLHVWHVTQKSDALLQETTLDGFLFGGTC